MYLTHSKLCYKQFLTNNGCLFLGMKVLKSAVQCPLVCSSVVLNSGVSPCTESTYEHFTLRQLRPTSCPSHFLNNAPKNDSLQQKSFETNKNMLL